MKSRVLYVWFQLAMGICNHVNAEILRRFNSIEEIYKCDDFSFLGEKRGKYIKNLENKDTSEAFEIIKRCESMRVRITGYYDSLYPEKLRGIEAPPAVLYSIGNFKNLNDVPCIGIVGTRKMSDYGRTVAEKFAYTFSKSGAYVVSGLALGVDTAAHRGAVMADGYTVAVLGNPIGDIYPRENLRAFETLYERGLVLSEMYPGCPRSRGDFPNRNRIISGLCDAVVIAEAGEKSGALITARYAINQGRRLYAVPGALGTSNAGTNSLIKTGVPVATEPYDVLATLALEYPQSLHPYEPAVTERLRSYGNVINPQPKQEEVFNQKSERELAERKAEHLNLKNAIDDCSNGLPSVRIKTALDGGKSLTADELSQKLGLPVSEILSELTLMEIYGEVTATAGGRFIKN